MTGEPLQPIPTYERIYEVVRLIPPGRVATYGQVASIVGNCTARMVGYAMAALPPGSDVPWQRVINAQGKISLRADSAGNARQRQLLEEEGISFDAQGRVNLRQVRWRGPQLDWLLEQGYDPAPSWREE
ncbi:MAG: cysteine methyltransferase [Chloroflexi bacterium]|nr:MAG: cysteine methyltransferase [Chloroflexota bacterium]